MFNDIDKKLRITAPANLILGLVFAWLTANFAKFVTKFNNKGEPAEFLEQAIVKKYSLIFAIVVIVVSVLSAIISVCITKKKTGAFKWAKKLGSFIRVLAYISLFIGAALVFMYVFWGFANIVSDNSFVSAVSYAILSIIPLIVCAASFSYFIYGFADAADGGKATYVKDSVFGKIDALYSEDDTRKICPECGTRTDRHSCPNCGAHVQ